MLLLEEQDMPKQCPDCRSVAQDDIGYCPACARRLGDLLEPRPFMQFWQYVAVGAATASIFTSIAYYWLAR
jgi:hypothetical protein